MAADIGIPAGAADLTPEWLTGALAPVDGSRVVAVDASPVGTGQIADSLRMALTWERPASTTATTTAGARPVPDTVVVKVTAASETSRAAAMATNTYAVEVGFYHDLAAALPVRTPHCYWAGFDPATAAYAVVLDDAAPAVQGDQLTGCSVDEAAAALAEAVLLHAPRWADPTLVALPWIRRGGRDRGGSLGPALTAMLPGFFERYGDRLSPSVVELIERFVPRMADYGSDREGPDTIVHGDFRIDNLMFGDDRVVVLDWQTVAVGAALSDVSYLLGGSLRTDDRRAAEADLVRGYWEQLTAFGGGAVALSWDECWADYRRCAFGGLIMAIFASMLVGRTERGDAMFVAMADRAGLHALDLDAEGLIPEARHREGN